MVSLRWWKIHELRFKLLCWHFLLPAPSWIYCLSSSPLKEARRSFDPRGQLLHCFSLGFPSSQKRSLTISEVLKKFMLYAAKSFPTYSASAFQLQAGDGAANLCKLL